MNSKKKEKIKIIDMVFLFFPIAVMLMIVFLAVDWGYVRKRIDIMVNPNLTAEQAHNRAEKNNQRIKAELDRLQRKDEQERAKFCVKRVKIMSMDIRDTINGGSYSKTIDYLPRICPEKYQGYHSCDKWLDCSKEYQDMFTALERNGYTVKKAENDKIIISW